MINRLTTSLQNSSPKRKNSDCNDQYMEQGIPLGNYLRELELDLAPIMKQIGNHKIFELITSKKKLAVFSEFHVYAVWDFMCLVKALQRRLCCMDLCWYPPTDTLGSHLIGRIIAEEESDETKDGRYLSHFEMYLEGMEQCGANIQGISFFIDDIKSGLPLEKALSKEYVPKLAGKFVLETFEIFNMQAHEIAASFSFARENITQKMFMPILKSLEQRENVESVEKFLFYFERHIELDGGIHNQLAKKLVSNLCMNDEKKWSEAKEAALFSLQSRLKFLNGIQEKIVTAEVM